MATHDSLYDALRSHVRALRPGRRIVSVRIQLDGGEELTVSMPPAHAPDFRSAVWAGRYHVFTPNQAAIVRILWEAWEASSPEVSQEYLTVEAGVRSTRLASLFRDHSAWGTMIVPGEGKGTYRLSDPS